MVKIISGKSAKWYEAHCCICGCDIPPQRERVKGKAVLMNDDVIRVIYCVGCAKQAQIQQAAESLKKVAA